MSKSRSRLVVVTAAGTGLAAGLALGVTGLASASTPSATSASPHAGSAAHGAHGQNGQHGKDKAGRGGELVTSVSGDTITLDTPRGVKTVSVNSATVYKHGAAKATLADVKPNEIVRVQLVDPKAANGVAKTITIEIAHVAGYVTAVNGSTVTITDRGGFTRTVQESSATVYRDAGAAGTTSEVTVGKFIRAEGNVDPNGTTLDATRISTGRAKPATAAGSTTG